MNVPRECSCFPRSFLREGHLFKVFVFLLQISVRVNRLKIDFPRVRARQEVFDFSLYLFTGRVQRAVYQSVRGEGFEENAFTCSVADFAVGEIGRVAREIRGKCWEKWDFPVAGWGELREGR